MSADKARVFYQSFVDRVKSMYVPERVFDGEFQAYMTVDLQNDGPTTLILDTDEYEGAVDYIRKRIEREEMSDSFYIVYRLDKHKNDKAMAEKRERQLKQQTESI